MYLFILLLKIDKISQITLEIVYFIIYNQYKCEYSVNWSCYAFRI